MGRTRGNCACSSAAILRGGCATATAPSRGPGRQPSGASPACWSKQIPSANTDPLVEAPDWGSETTINDAILGWQRNGWDDLSPSTTRRYQNIWQVHIRHSIGLRRIATLSPSDVEQVFRALKTSGLSEASVRQARAVLHRACRLARRWSSNTLPNPIADTELPAWSAEDALAVRAPTPAEVHALLDAGQGEDLRLATYFRTVGRQRAVDQ